MSLVVDANEYVVEGKVYKFSDTLELPKNDDEFDIVLHNANNTKVLFRFSKF